MIFHFLLSHLFHLGVMLAATATVGVGDIGAGADALNDSADNADSTGGEATEGEATEGESNVDGQNDGVAEETPGSQKNTDTKVDWRSVPQEVKSHIQELQKTNPKLANLVQNAVYTSQTFLREIPGGLKEIRAIKSSIDQLGGLEEMKTLSTTHKALVEEQESLDAKAREGSPEVLDTLEQVAGEGFYKLMPNALSRWAANDKDSYNHEVSKIFVGAMKDGGLVSDLNLAFRMLRLGTPEATKEAMECLNRAAEWANGINQLALKAPQKAVVDPKIAEQQKNIETERTKLFNDKFGNEFGSWRSRQIKDEVVKISGNRQLNEYQSRTLNERIVSDIRDILTTDTDYMKSLERIYNSRDMAELQKFTRARTSKILPEVTKKAYRSLFGGAPAKKAVVKTVEQQKAGTATAGPVKGWAKVTADKAPRPELIDDKKTSFEMKFRKQAILKDGSKIYWGDRVPA